MLSNLYIALEGLTPDDLKHCRPGYILCETYAKSQRPDLIVTAAGGGSTVFPPDIPRLQLCEPPRYGFQLRQRINEQISRHPANVRLDEAGRLLLNERGIYFLEDGLFRGLAHQRVEAIEARGHYCRFHYSGGRPLTFRIGIRRLEKLLAPAGFISVHRGYLVNLHHVSRFQFPASNVLLHSGSCVPISRARRKGLRQFAAGNVAVN